MNDMRSKLVLALTVACILMLSGVSAVSAGKPVKGKPFKVVKNSITVASDLSVGGDGMYIVRLTDRPIATYDGGIQGLAPTSAQATGRNRLDTNSPAARAYRRYLQDQQQAVLASAERDLGRGMNPRFQYQHAVNGFAIELSTAEAKVIRLMDGVAAVELERMERPLTDAGPAWIGAPKLWSNPPNSTMGEGVVVAVLDTGINHDHPSFADVGADGYNHTNPLGSGIYIPGSYCDTTDPSFCNDKLIGAWDMVQTEADPDSPEDSDGHGSHTTSTVAGNVSQSVVIAETQINFALNSGVAPHANIIIYDVCIDSCPGSALVAAIDQVLIDAGNLPNGIAALNYSISGGGDPYNDTVELGFLAAVQAGVYVSASAGNSGPAASTVAHLGPWVSTTAASTHNRTYPKTLLDLHSDGDGKLGEPADVFGAGFTSGFGPAQIVHASSAGDGQCLSPFAAGTFSGEIVVCDRGEIARVEKGLNVLLGGAGGFILANLNANGESVNGDAHFLPAIHIGATAGNWIRSWLAANTNTSGTLGPFSVGLDPADGDIMDSFSSRGPQLAFDVLKPDITAPGVDVLAAIANGGAPPTPFGEWGLLSGTSMSSPHNAGSGALMTALRPDLTPQEIKSAIMMTSVTTVLKEDAATPADPFDMGAGRISLDDAKDAHLVLSETTTNFLNADPDLGGDPGTLNLPSMMDSHCVGICGWQRTLTNSEGSPELWEVSTTSPPGINFSFSIPGGGTALALLGGQSKSITVMADTSLAAEGWYFGSLNMVRELTKGPTLHMPIAVFAARSTNPDVFVKTVDKDTAGPGDTLTYELTVTNGPYFAPVLVQDILPPGTTLVAGSETEVVTDGTTLFPWSDTGGSLTWMGILDLGGLDVLAGDEGGYLPLSLFGPPFDLPSNCDDGGWILDVPSFTFNGDNYNSVIWSVNGTVEAGTASGQATSFFNRDMPDSALPNNLIAPFWADLNLCEGGNWYVNVLSDGTNAWLVLEWEDIPHWFSGPDSATFQVWILLDGGLPGPPQAHFTYARLDRELPDATVGAENSTGTLGDAYYFNGAGTEAVVGQDLIVETPSGGSATLGFQATTDCSVSTLVNLGNLIDTASDDREQAIAVTRCTAK